MNKRMRGRQGGGRRPHMMNGGGGGGGNRSFESNGPEVKIRGTAAQIFDRYCQLARDANSSGDRVAAENYLQHAEHYYRIMLAQGTAGPRAQNQQGQGGGQHPNGNGQAMTGFEAEMAEANAEGGGVEQGGEPEEAAA